uniref:Uncharacterized protein n=1 Tax=Anguilla anguilla TaxID=7936 RepID=A0A0E9X9T6_ANGAN
MAMQQAGRRKRTPWFSNDAVSTNCAIQQYSV